MIGSYLDYLEEIMFFSTQFVRGVLLFSFGGVVIVIAIAILKIWENRKSVQREIRRQIDSNKARQPEENDERFDYEGESYDSNNIFFMRLTVLKLSSKGIMYVSSSIKEIFDTSFSGWTCCTGNVRTEK